MRGLFLDIDTVDRGDLDLAGLRATLPEWTFRKTGTGKSAEPPLQADIIISNKVEVDANTINSSANLKLICIAATGTNNVDLAAAAKRCQAHQSLSSWSASRSRTRCRKSRIWASISDRIAIARDSR